MHNMIEMFLRIFALTRKELLSALKDRRARFSIVVPPMLQCLLFGYAATYDLNNINYAVFDQDRGAATHELLARFDGSGVFHRVGNLDRMADVKSFIDDRRAMLVIQIGQDFERELIAGNSAQLQIIADGRNSNTAATAIGYANQIVDTFNTDWRASHGQSQPAVKLVRRAWYNPNLETRWSMIPGMIGMLILMQMLLLTAMSVTREREEGTFDQLLVTPFRPLEIMAGKALPSILIGIVQAASILLVAQLWFRIPFSGSFLTLYVGLGIFLLASVGIGLLVSSIATTLQQGLLYSFVLIMPFVLLSGLTTPISSMPETLQYITLLNPLRYAIDIAQRVYLEGAGFTELVPDLWPLALMGAVTLSTASWLFRRSK